MFSDYASRLIQQSHQRMSHNRSNPLFHSTHDDRDDVRESMALRQSRAGIGSRFGAFRLTESIDEQDDDEDEHTEHDAMRTSWVPPHQKLTSGKKEHPRDNIDAAPVELSSSMDSTTMFEQPQGSAHENETTGEEREVHNEAPDDIMFGVPLSDSIPPYSLAGSAVSSPVIPHIEESIQGQDSITEEGIPTMLLAPEITSNLHDRGYAALFVFCQASIFATSFFVFLTTETPSTTMTDSIYSVLTNYMGLIIRDIFIALIVSATWLCALKLFVKPFLYATIVFVPIVVITMSSYLLSWSYRGSYGGYEVQARAMRWSSLFMFFFASVWIYTVYSRRHVVSKTVSIIKLSCTVLEHNTCLLLLGLGNLWTFVIYSFIWVHQFERIFLRGTLVGSGPAQRWLLESKSWFVGAYFVWMFLWTLGVLSGIQRAATSAAVSHWYFHRHDLPQSSQQDVTSAALMHSLTTSFGSICASSFLGLLTRLPLVALPRRLSGLISLGAYMLLSAPILNLTNPLSLSYASIHSIDIGTAAKSIQQHVVLSPMYSSAAYRTSKMLLSAARATTSLGLGTAAWISSARGIDGQASIYGYVVGLVAGAIGWAVVGAIEGMMSMIVDATFVCYGIDLASSRQGQSHCLEAMNAFGNGRIQSNGALQV